MARRESDIGLKSNQKISASKYPLSSSQALIHLEEETKAKENQSDSQLQTNSQPVSRNNSSSFFPSVSSGQRSRLPSQSKSITQQGQETISEDSRPRLPSQSKSLRPKSRKPQEQLIISDQIFEGLLELQGLNKLTSSKHIKKYIRKIKPFIYLAREFRDGNLLKFLTSSFNKIPESDIAETLMKKLHKKKLPIRDKKERFLNLPLINDLAMEFNEVNLSAVRTAKNAISNEIMNFLIGDDAALITKERILKEIFQELGFFHLQDFLYDRFVRISKKEAKERNAKYYEKRENALKISLATRDALFELAVRYSVEKLFPYCHPERINALTRAITDACRRIYINIMERREQGSEQFLENEIYDVSMEIEGKTHQYKINYKVMKEFVDSINENMGLIISAYQAEYKKKITSKEDFKDMNFSDKLMWNGMVKLFHTPEFYEFSDFSGVTDENKKRLNEIFDEYQGEETENGESKRFKERELAFFDCFKLLFQGYDDDLNQAMKAYKENKDAKVLISTLRVLVDKSSFRELAFEIVRLYEKIVDEQELILNQRKLLNETQSLPSLEHKKKYDILINKYLANLNGPIVKEVFESAPFQNFAFHITKLIYSKDKNSPAELGCAIKALLANAAALVDLGGGNQSPERKETIRIVTEFKEAHPLFVSSLLKLSEEDLLSILKTIAAKYFTWKSLLGSQAKKKAANEPALLLFTPDEIKEKVMPGYSKSPNEDVISEIESMADLMGLSVFAKQKLHTALHGSQNGLDIIELLVGKSLLSVDAKKKIQNLVKDLRDDIVPKLDKFMTEEVLTPIIKRETTQNKEFYEILIRLVRDHRFDFKKAFEAEWNAFFSSIAQRFTYLAATPLAAQPSSLMSYTLFRIHFSKLKAFEKKAICFRNHEFLCMVYMIPQRTAAEAIGKGFPAPKNESKEVREQKRERQSHVEQLTSDLEELGHDGFVGESRIHYSKVVAVFAYGLAGLKDLTDPLDPEAVLDFSKQKDNIQDLQKLSADEKKDLIKKRQLTLGYYRDFKSLLLQYIEEVNQDIQVKKTCYAFALFMAVQADDYESFKDIISRIEKESNSIDMFRSILKISYNNNILFNYVATSESEDKEKFIEELLKLYKSYGLIQETRAGLVEVLFEAVETSGALIRNILEFSKRFSSEKSILLEKNSAKQTALELAFKSNKINTARIILNACCQEGLKEVVEEAVRNLDLENKALIKMVAEESLLDSLGLAGERLFLAIRVNNRNVVTEILRQNSLEIFKHKKKGFDPCAYAAYLVMEKKIDGEILESICQAIVGKVDENNKSDWIYFMANSIPFVSSDPSKNIQVRRKIYKLIEPSLKKLGINELAERQGIKVRGNSESIASKDSGSSSSKYEMKETEETKEAKSDPTNSDRKRQILKFWKEFHHESGKKEKSSPESSEIRDDDFIYKLSEDPNVKLNISNFFEPTSAKSSIDKIKELIKNFHKLEHPDGLIKALKNINRYQPNIFKEFDESITAFYAAIPVGATEKDRHKALCDKIKAGLRNRPSPDVFIPEMLQCYDKEEDKKYYFTEENINYYFDVEHKINSIKLLLPSVKNLFTLNLKERSNLVVVLKLLYKCQKDLFLKQFLIEIISVYRENFQANSPVCRQIDTDLLQPCLQYIKDNYGQLLIDTLVSTENAKTSIEEKLSTMAREIKRLEEELKKESPLKAGEKKRLEVSLEEKLFLEEQEKHEKERLRVLQEENIKAIFMIEIWGKQLGLSSDDCAKISAGSVRFMQEYVGKIFSREYSPHSLIVVLEKISQVHRDIFLKELYPVILSNYKKYQSANEEKLTASNKLIAELRKNPEDFKKEEIEDKFDNNKKKTNFIPKSNKALDASTENRALQGIQALYKTIYSKLLQPHEANVENEPESVQVFSPMKMC